MRRPVAAKPRLQASVDGTAERLAALRGEGGHVGATLSGILPGPRGTHTAGPKVIG
jgi:hypothetical protein